MVTRVFEPHIEQLLFTNQMHRFDPRRDTVLNAEHLSNRKLKVLIENY